MALQSTAVRVQTIYQKDDILAVRHNRRGEISPFWLAVLLEDVQIEVYGGNFVQQRVSLKWLNQASDSLTYTTGDICNGNSPKCILTEYSTFPPPGKAKSYILYLYFIYKTMYTSGKKRTSFFVITK